MKNNEYNIVKVTNEKSNFGYEYTKAQNVEYSFQSENKNPIKDELNDNSTVNDKVEDNVLKSSKDNKKKKEKHESSELNNTTSKTSSLVSNTAVTSSSGATIAGSLGGIVAATTVTVVAVGASIGINVIGPSKEPELATFLTSEITAHSIDFSFSMPSIILRYEEESEPDTPISERNVVFKIDNGLGYHTEEYLVEYEEYDPEHFIYYGHMGGLTPETSYALTVAIKEENPEYENPIYKELGRRTFYTLSIGEAFKFESIETTSTSVYFSFIVGNELVEYDPSLSRLPAIQASITDNKDFYDEIWIESLEQYDESNLICYGDFTNLSPSTSYTLSIGVSLETEFRELSKTIITTEAKPSTGFRWGYVRSEEDGVVEFSFYVNSSYVGYSEGDELENVYAIVSLNGEEVNRSNSISYSKYNDTIVTGNGSISDLEGSTTYELSIVYYHNQEEDLLGDPKEFTTPEADPLFYFEDPDTYFIVGETYITPTFLIKQSEVEEVSENETNIYIDIIGGYGHSESINVLSEYLSPADNSYYTAGRSISFDNLSPCTTYTISARNSSTDMSYQSIEVTTSGEDVGFSISAISFDTSSVTAQFSLDTTYVNEVGSENIFIQAISDEGTSSNESSVRVMESGEDSTDLLATINDLSSDTHYSLRFYYREPTTFAETLLGLSDFTTEAEPGPNFSWGSFEITATSAVIRFNISSAYLNYDADPTAAVANLYIEVKSGEDVVDSVGLYSLTPDEGDNLIGVANISDLTSVTIYTISLYQIVDSDSIMIGEPTTFETEDTNPAFDGTSTHSDPQVIIIAKGVTFTFA